MKLIVDIMEYERGWGNRCDETKEFTDLNKAVEFVTSFNKPNHDNWNKTHTVPDWYMVAVPRNFTIDN